MRVGFNFIINDHVIYGYCRYLNIYRNMVNLHIDNDIFVEVGSFLGQSTCAMGYFIKESSKNIKFTAVDLWEIGDYSDSEHYEVIQEAGGDFYKAYCNNVEKADVRQYINDLKMSSVEAAKQFEDNSISMCMIDAGHTTEDVIRDIEAWLPKIKKNGFMLFDDMDWPSVKEAVYSKFNSTKISYNGTTGIYENNI